MHMRLYIRNYCRGVYNPQSDKHLWVEGLELKTRMAVQSLQIVLHFIQADFS